MTRRISETELETWVIGNLGIIEYRLDFIARQLPLGDLIFCAEMRKVTM